MSWAIGYDEHWKRDIGYGVPAYCDHPGCKAEIDRGLSYVCGGEPYGGEYGCGLYFCGEHRAWTERRPERCKRCREGRSPYKRLSPEHPEWLEWKATDPSWAEWRAEQRNALS
jgi:hypothetical protein